jgi:hypothetical protein
VVGITLRDAARELESTMAVLLVTVVLFSIIPFILYFGQGGGHAPSWGVIAAGEEQLGAGAYRQQRVMRWKRGSAPPVVRAAAITCFYLGQMVVPGGFLALAGLAFVFEPPAPPTVWTVLELSAPSGMIVATLLLGAGWTMLEGTPDAVPAARRAWRWAIVHNVGLVVALTVAAAGDPSEWEACVMPLTYAGVSIVQALLVWRAAAAVAAYDAARKLTPAPPDVESEALG